MKSSIKTEIAEITTRPGGGAADALGSRNRIIALPDRQQAGHDAEDNALDDAFVYVADFQG